MTSYKTTTVWKGGHTGEITCSNDTHMDFSAPAALYGQPNVLTPEDAFVGALNMCFQLMFIWSIEKLKIDLVSYECETEGFVEDLLDRTSIFKKMVLRPKITVRNCREEMVRRALNLAEKYSLVAQSIKAELMVEPEIQVI
ncbi:OsmC family protein [Candidatus Bathyarchaeota archaeon]|nr:OsmC family protein [Candidatus Bathyarchaeota archaeon]